MAQPMLYLLYCFIIWNAASSPIENPLNASSADLMHPNASSAYSLDDDDNENISELSLFMPDLKKAIFISILLSYLLWNMALIVDYVFVYFQPIEEDEASLYNEHYKHMKLSLELDKKSRMGNWEAVEECIQIGGIPSTKVLCRAYAANQYKLVNDILNRKEELHFEPDLRVILSKKDCSVLIEQMIAENHIKYVDGKLLLSASRYGHLSLVRYILKMKQLKITKTHLNLAILSGNNKLVSFFVDNFNLTPGADALEIACYSRRVDLLRYLENRFGDSFDLPSLHAIIFDWQVLRYFVQEKDYPITHYMLKQTALYGYFESFKFLEQYYALGADSNVLDFACFGGNLSFVKYLVEESKIQPNIFNLDSAALNGQLKVVQYLMNERNITHDNFVERMANGSKNVELYEFLKEKEKKDRVRIFPPFWSCPFWGFNRRLFHTNFLKQITTSSYHHNKAEMKRLSIT